MTIVDSKSNILPPDGQIYIHQHRGQDPQHLQLKVKKKSNSIDPFDPFYETTYNSAPAAEEQGTRSYRGRDYSWGNTEKSHTARTGTAGRSYVLIL